MLFMIKGVSRSDRPGIALLRKRFVSVAWLLEDRNLHSVVSADRFQLLSSFQKRTAAESGLDIR